MFQDVTSMFSSGDIAENKGLAAMAHIPILFWLPLVSSTAKNSPYARYASNNGLLLLIFGIAISWLLDFLPLGNLIVRLWDLAVFIVIIYMLVQFSRGFAKKLPIFGDIRIIK